MIVRFALLFGIGAMLLTQAGMAQSNPQQDLEKLATATALDREGMAPWHLKMSFELNDLNGNPKEKGTIEEWWISPKSRRLVITSPSYNTTFPGVGGAQQVPNRESHLANELLDQVVHPIPRYGSFEDLNVDEHEQMFGNIKLSCLYVMRKSPKGPVSVDSPMYCVEPGTNVLRIISILREPYVVRNRIGDFLNTTVAIDDAVSYGGRIAIIGHVDVLETCKPDAGSGQAAATPVEASDNGSAAPVVPGIVLAGKVLRKVPPDYPEIAKMKHIGGTVILGGIISKAGRFSTLYVIASPDQSLSASSLDAVKQWRYQPYLLNGQPTEVDTTITVNFNLNGR